MTDKPRSESRQRPKLVGVRLTEEEFAWLEARAERAGVKVPTLIRRAVLFNFDARLTPTPHDEGK
jgi:hypothetical protein